MIAFPKQTTTRARRDDGAWRDVPNPSTTYPGQAAALREMMVRPLEPARDESAFRPAAVVSPEPEEYERWDGMS